jgi:hypothetical protein
VKLLLSPYCPALLASGASLPAWGDDAGKTSTGLRPQAGRESAHGQPPGEPLRGHEADVQGCFAVDRFDSAEGAPVFDRAIPSGDSWTKGGKTRGQTVTV